MTNEHYCYPTARLTHTLEVSHGDCQSETGRPDTTIRVWRWGTCEVCRKRSCEQVLSVTFPPVPFEMSANVPSVEMALVRGVEELAGILRHDVLEGKSKIRWYASQPAARPVEITSM